MMREIASTIVAIIAVLYLMWYAFPIVINTKNQLFQYINQTEPATAQMIQIADSFYIAWPVIIALVAGFTLFLIATRRVAIDV